MGFKQVIFLSFVIALTGQYVNSQETSVAPTTPTPPPPPPPPPPMPKRSCVEAGLMCSDCHNQALCIGDGEGSFTQIESRCPPKSHCVENACVEGAKCNYRPFECTDEGFFPDPYDCLTYHVCILNGQGKFQGMEMKCGPGRGSYDASTGSCGYPLNSTACLQGPVPPCNATLQTEALKSDPSMYFVCTEKGPNIGPELFKCAGGKLFDNKKTSCVESTASKKAKKPK